MKESNSLDFLFFFLNESSSLFVSSFSLFFFSFFVFPKCILLSIRVILLSIRVNEWECYPGVRKTKFWKTKTEEPKKEDLKLKS